MKRLFVFMLCLIPGVSLASYAEYRNGKVLVHLTRDECRKLIVNHKHHPRDDVAYKPGTGARGKPVLPADVGGTPVFKFPEKITVPIDLNLVERFGLDVEKGIELKPEISELTIHQDGRVSFNGTPLEDKTTQYLKSICREKYKM